MYRLESVKITKLFGYKGNDYNVNFIKDGLITFVYAFNGVGKTTLLKLLYAIINQNFRILFLIDFESIILNFTQDKQLIVKKEKKENNRVSFSYELRLPKKLKIMGYHSLIESVPIDSEEDFFEKEIKYPEIKLFLDNLGTDILFANKDYGRVVRANESYSEFDASYLDTDYVPVSLQVVKQLIEANENEISDNKERLKDEENSKNGKPQRRAESIIKTAAKLGPLAVPAALAAGLLGPLGMIGTAGALGAVGALGAAGTLGGAASVAALGTAVGLYNRNKKISKEGIESYSKYIDIPLPDKINYIQKSFKKYIEAGENNIEKKIALFEDIINTYNTLTDKTLHVSRETGKIGIQTIFSDSEPLDAKYLSSGEKNVLLLYFYIIFTIPDKKTDDKTFIALIDEPEVSMHPAWLMNFVKSLNRINDVLDRKANYQYIITTHSPGITYANSNLMVELKRD